MSRGKKSPLGLKIKLPVRIDSPEWIQYEYQTTGPIDSIKLLRCRGLCSYSHEEL